MKLSVNKSRSTIFENTLALLAIIYFLEPGSKLYIPSTLNTDHRVSHSELTISNLCRVDRNMQIIFGLKVVWES